MQITGCPTHMYNHQFKFETEIWKLNFDFPTMYLQLEVSGQLYQNSANLWQAWLLLYIACFTALHALGSWLAVNAICCCWGDFYEWSCTVCDASSASQERTRQRFTEFDYNAVIGHDLQAGLILSLKLALYALP